MESWSSDGHPVPRGTQEVSVNPVINGDAESEPGRTPEPVVTVTLTVAGWKMDATGGRS
jgi:hypothetical protein